jgi:hypothetical protein
LKAAAICPSIPPQFDGNRTEKLPSRNATMVASICLDRASTEPFPIGLFAFADFLERGIIVSIMVHQDLSF